MAGGPSTAGGPAALILGGRVLLLGGAAAVLALAILSTVGDGHAGPGPGGDGDVGKDGAAYVCPMHPQVTAPAAADCSICGMALEPRRAGGATGVATTGAAADPDFALSSETALRSFHDVTRARFYRSSREMRAPARLEGPAVGAALMYNEEIALLRPRERALFFPAVRPGAGAAAGVEARLTGEPPVAWDAATSLVRFRLRGGAVDVARGVDVGGDVGWLKLAARVRDGLVVPYASVLQSGDGPFVLLVGDDRRTLTRRPIQLGGVLFGYAAVLAGLKDGDRVAAMNTFFLDVERRADQRAAR
jgi:hypothetical protein